MWEPTTAYYPTAALEEKQALLAKRSVEETKKLDLPSASHALSTLHPAFRSSNAEKIQSASRSVFWRHAWHAGSSGGNAMYCNSLPEHVSSLMS